MRLQAHRLLFTTMYVGKVLFPCASTLKTVPSDMVQRQALAQQFLCRKHLIVPGPRKLCQTTSADKGSAAHYKSATGYGTKEELVSDGTDRWDSTHSSVWVTRNEQWMDQEGYFSLQLQAQYRPAPRGGLSGDAAYFPEGIPY